MLQPIKVIIQDFPKFLSAFLPFKLLAIKLTLASKVLAKTTFDVKLFAVKTYMVANKVRNQMFVNFDIKLSLKQSALGKLLQRATFHSKTGQRNYIPSVFAKILQKGTIKSKVVANKNYLDPTKYQIGVASTLGKWDGATNNTKLLDMDDLTMNEISITEV